jgi:hypothetical protein
MWKRHGKETKRKKCIIHTHAIQIQQKWKMNVGLDSWNESSKSLKFKLGWICINMKHNAHFCWTTFSKLQHKLLESMQQQKIQVTISSPNVKPMIFNIKVWLLHAKA